MKYKIAPDFASLMPPHTAEEIATMEKNIVAQPDAFPPVVLWSNHHNTVIEGHLRLRLFTKHGLTPKFIKLDFPDRASAFAYAVSCQVGRRNLPAGQAAMLLTKYPIPLGDKPRPGGAEDHPKGDEPRSPTNRGSAEIAGVSQRTIQKANQVRRDAPAATVKAVEQGKKTLNQAVAEIKPKKERPELAAFKKIDTALGKMIRDASDINKDLAPSKHFEEFKDGLDKASRALTQWRRQAK